MQVVTTLKCHGNQIPVLYPLVNPCCKQMANLLGSLIIQLDYQQVFRFFHVLTLQHQDSFFAALLMILLSIDHLRWHNQIQLMLKELFLQQILTNVYQLENK